MDTPSRYKEQKLARVRIAKQLLIFRKYHHWDAGSFLRAQAKDTEQNMGNQRRQKTLHSKMQHEHKKVMYVSLQIKVTNLVATDARFTTRHIARLFRLPYQRVNL